MTMRAPVPGAEWLCLRIDDGMPAEWRSLVDEFVDVAQVMLGSAAPARLQIRCKRLGDRMSLGLRFSSDVEHAKRRALRGLARRFTESSRHSLAVREEPLFMLEPLDLPTAQAEPEAIDEEAAAIDLQSCGQPMVQVFDWDPIEANVGGADRGRHEDAASRMGKAMSRLRKSGRTRPRSLPPINWWQLLDQLEERFPNFAPVINGAIRAHVALTAAGLTHRLPPLLLVGPPGIGKTFFAKALCNALGVPSPLFVSMASETNGAALGGSSTFWSNSSPGQLFESLAWGCRGERAIANGLVVIDEVDKVSTRDYNPLGALYSLLETDTARVFVDQSLPDVVMDASHLRIVCTANDLDSIPLPIRSRMLIYAVEAPAGEQAVGIVLSIFATVVKSLGVQLDPSLPQIIVDDAIQVEPRQVRLLLEAAIANALTAGRDRVSVQDWRAVRGASGTSRRAPMGFVDSACRR